MEEGCLRFLAGHRNGKGVGEWRGGLGDLHRPSPDSSLPFGMTVGEGTGGKNIGRRPNARLCNSRAMKFDLTGSLLQVEW